MSHDRDDSPAARIALLPAPDEPSLHRAAELSKRLNLPCLEAALPADSAADPFDLHLLVDPQGLTLRPVDGSTGGVRCDFIGGPFGYRRRQGGQGALRAQEVVKAVGFKNPPRNILDATAGLGRDAALLALVGCHVTAIERNPIIAALLEDGLLRAAAAENIDWPRRAAAPAADAPSEHWLQRLTLIHSDARDHLRKLPSAGRPDVVYLDPMFPHRTKSALVKKEMRLCRAIAGEDPDAPALLHAALAIARRRVVVKRAAHAPAIEGPEPSMIRKGASIRYDIYLIHE